MQLNNLADSVNFKVQRKRGEPWPSIEGDPTLQEQYQVLTGIAHRSQVLQAGIRDLSRRLDLLEVAEEREEQLSAAR